jgi:hypothetical protein
MVVDASQCMTLATSGTATVGAEGRLRIVDLAQTHRFRPQPPDRPGHPHGPERAGSSARPAKTTPAAPTPPSPPPAATRSAAPRRRTSTRFARGSWMRWTTGTLPTSVGSSVACRHIAQTDGPHLRGRP